MPTYYVDFTSGSDANNGTSAITAFKHPPCSNLDSGNSDSASSALAAGDIIYLKKGEIWENTVLTIARDGASGNPIIYSTLDGFGTGANPIISANTYYPAGWTASGSEYYVGSIAADPLTCWDGTTKLTKATVGALTAGQWGYDAGNTRVYVRLAGDTDPNGRSVNFPTQNQPLLFSSSDYISVSNIILEGAKSSTPGVIYVNPGTNLTLSNITIRKPTSFHIRTLGTSTNNMFSAITTQDTPATYSFRIAGDAGGTTVQNSTFNHVVSIESSGNIVSLLNNTIASTSNGISINSAGTGHVITGNTITGPGSAYGILLLTTAGVNHTISNNSVSGFQYGIFLTAGLVHSGITISGNTVFDMAGAAGIGIQNVGANTVSSNTVTNIPIYGIRNVAGNGTITGNTITDIWNDSNYGAGGGGVGIAIDAGSPSILRNKISLCYLGINSITTDSVTIAYNLILNSLVNALEVASVSPAVASVFNNTIYHAPNTDVIADNGHAIIVRTGAETKKAIIKNNIIYMVTTNAGQDGLQIDDAADEVALSNNIYFEDTTTANGNLISHDETIYDADFAGWVTATSDSGSQIADPLFVSATDFRLSPASPAINAGVDVGLTSDYAGNAIVGPPNIGSYETGGVYEQGGPSGTINIHGTPTIPSMQ